MSLNQVNMSMSVGQSEMERFIVTTVDHKPFMLTGFTYELVATEANPEGEAPAAQTVALELREGDSSLWIPTEILAAAAMVWDYQINRIKDAKRKRIFSGRITVS